jgi:hypothetical protein
LVSLAGINNRYWSSQDPHLTHEVLLHPVKAGVWCAASTSTIVGPVFFNETINRERYVQVILGKFFPELTEEKRLYGWFQKDPATAHTARMSKQVLSSIFGDRTISSCIWPECSPDLNPYDFFFWGCLEDKVYNRNLQAEELKENIRRGIPADQL